MSFPDESESALPAGHGWFTTTHWSIVLAAGAAGSPQAEEALERLCRTYRYPVYACVRRRGYSHHDAEDLTQGFFAHLLQKNRVGQVRREKGKFRSFLLASIKHFLLDESAKTRAAKRGGGVRHSSLDAPDDQPLEERYKREPADPKTPEKSFARDWASTVLEEAQARLRGEYASARKGELFERLHDFLTREPNAATQAQIGAEFGMTESAIKSAVHRLRLRYRELIREVVADTVVTVDEIDEEIRELRAALSG